ncbi:MAG: hypothetical protein QXQ28_02300 [Candidatus Nezhaarchaeales archaeon]
MMAEIGLLTTYLTIGLTPILYNYLMVKKVLKRHKETHDLLCRHMEEDKKHHKEVHVLTPISEGRRTVTLRVPCYVTMLHDEDGLKILQLTLNHDHLFNQWELGRNLSLSEDKAVRSGL